jgi:hypothetical protein
MNESIWKRKKGEAETARRIGAYVSGKRDHKPLIFNKSDT